MSACATSTIILYHCYLNMNTVIHTKLDKLFTTMQYTATDQCAMSDIFGCLNELSDLYMALSGVKSEYSIVEGVQGHESRRDQGVLDWKQQQVRGGN